MKLLKNFNLSLVALVFFTSLGAAILFTTSRSKSNDVVLASKRLENRRLPASILRKINEEKFFVVYLASGCGSCSDELALLAELNINFPELKIFGVMGEDESVIKNYVRDHNIKFPIIADPGLDMLRDLKLEFFPTNLTIENGIIKRAYLGAPENKEKLFTLISD